LVAARGIFLAKAAKTVKEALWIGCLFLFSSLASAIDRNVYEFNLPQQSLVESLNTLSSQTKTLVLFPYDLVENKTAKPLRGSFTVLQALNIILADSDLVGGQSKKGVLTISKRESEETINNKRNENMKSNKSLLATLIGVLATAGSTQALSQGSEVAGLEEVIITAQKRSQNLQEVSAAVTAFSGDQLSDSQINNIEDLQVLLPGLTFGNDFNFAKIFVRGVGMSSSFAGIDPSVALHVDGAVISQAAAQFTSLFDLERVEVLRGPQGTLYGRNATGGSVNLITRKPSEEFEGHIKVTAGGPDSNFIAEGAVGGAITDGLTGRVAVYRNKRDGYGTHTGTGSDIDDANKTGVRGQIHWTINDRIDNLFSAEYYDEDENSRAVKFIRSSFPNTTNPGLAAIGFPDVSQNSRDAGGDFVPIAELETTSFTNTFTYDVSELLSIKSITNVRDFSNLLLQDFDVSDTVNGTLPPSVTSTTQLQTIDSKQYSEELQFSFNAESWRGLFGLYYFNEEIESTVLIGRDPLYTPRNATTPASAPPDLVRVAVFADLDVEAYAAFANFTFDLTEALALKVGARYSHEEREVENLFGVAPPPAPGPIYDPVGNDKKSYSKATPEIGLEYTLEDGTLLFATYSEGFKSGTANLGERFPSLINEETIDNIEVGLKGTYLDNTLQLNLAGFIYQVEDAQFDRTFPIPVPPFFSAKLENAAVTDGQGIEIEARWAPIANLTLDMNATFYDIEFDEFESLDPLNEDLFGANSTTVGRTDLSGNSPRNTPDWTYNIHAAYDIPLEGGATVTVAGNYARKAEQFYTEFNNPVMGAEEYGILDANLMFTSADDRLTVNLWGKNLTDEFIVSGAFAISTSRTITGTYLPPRQYGVTVGYNF
jgi:iron complex outermembrane receptor protein